MTEIAHNVEHAALQQLETALRLYCEGEDYYSAITLAGAAEEILGKTLAAKNEERRKTLGLGEEDAAEKIPEELFGDASFLYENALESDIRNAAILSEALDGEGLLQKESDTPEERRQQEREYKKFSKEIANHANYPRNALKHWSPGEPEDKVFDAQKEAKDMLDRAIENYYRLTGQLTSAMEKFVAMRVKDDPQLR